MIKLRPIALSLSLLAFSTLTTQAQNLGLAAASDTQAQAIMEINANTLRNGDNLWQRIREGVQMSEVNPEIVRKDERQYAANPATLRRSLERSRKYMFYIMNEVERRGMPTEIALLPVVESSYMPGANSPVGASGLWQFMPATGKDYGLEQTWWYDGRRDVTASTNAALDYLEKLHSMFGDWSLALAGYNWGEGNVARAMQRAQAAGLKPTYENIRMPNETRSYVPKLLAVRNALMEPEKYGLSIKKLPNKPYFRAITVSRHMDINLAAKFAGVSVDEFKTLNPGFNLPVFAYKSGRKMLIPVNHVAEFNRNLSKWGSKPLMSWKVYVPDTKRSLSQVAMEYGMSENQLRMINMVRGNTLNAGKPVLVALDVNRKTQTFTDNVLLAKQEATSIKTEVIASANTNKTSTIAENNESNEDSIALFAKDNSNNTSIRNLVGQDEPSRFKTVALSDSVQVEKEPLPPLSQKVVVAAEKPTVMRYTVQSGDTLYGIAQKYGTSLENIKNLNHLNDDTARLGVVLKIQMPSSKINIANSTDPISKVSVDYVVKKGDTAYSIARKFGIKYSDLKLPLGDHLTPGQLIKVQGI